MSHSDNWLDDPGSSFATLVTRNAHQWSGELESAVERSADILRIDAWSTSTLELIDPTVDPERPHRRVAPVDADLELAYLSDLARSAESPSALAEIVSKLRIVSFGREPNVFQPWFEATIREFIISGASALAALLEVASSRADDFLPDVFASALEMETVAPMAVAVAAQRARLLTVSDRDMRSRLARALQRRILEWERTLDTRHLAASAWPSLPLFSGVDALPMIIDRISGEDSFLAWAASHAALEWLVKRQAIEFPSSRGADNLFDCVDKRLAVTQQESSADSSLPELQPVLLWLLGATTTSSTLSRATRQLVDSFVTGSAIVGAGAIRGARVLLARLGPVAVRSLADAFDVAESKDRFFFLLAEVPAVSQWR